MVKRTPARRHIVQATDTFKELLGLYIGVVLVSSLLYAWFEGKSVWDGVWWAIITSATVGYGDQYPLTTEGRVVGIVLVLFTVLFLVPLITARMASHMIVNNDAWTHSEQEEIKAELDKILQALNASKSQ